MPLKVFSSVLSVLLGTSALALAQPATHIPTVPNELLSRPVALRTGIGKAHDPVSTQSVDAQAFYDQGLACLHSYLWIEAARAFNQAARLDSQLATAHVGLSIAYTELNKPDAAAEALARAQERVGQLSDHDWWHIRARVAEAAAEAAPANRAKLTAYRQLLDSALKAQPDDAELWMLRGMAESADPGDRGQGSVASALPYYEKALALGGQSAHHYLTHAYENAGQYERAADHAASFAALAPNVPHALHMHGHVLRRTGQIARAVAAFEAADRVQKAYFDAEKVPPEYEWHHEHNLDLLGSSYQYLGQMNKAERDLKAAFDLPSMLVVQMYSKRSWPEFLIGRGRLDEALASAGVLIAHPVSLVKATGHIEAGHAHLAAGRFAQAAEQTNLALHTLRTAATGQALVAPALQQLQGEFYLRTGGREKGRSMLRDLVRTARTLPGPDNWVQALFILESIGRTARVSGDLEFAGRVAAQMIDHDSNYAGSHYLAGLVARDAGDTATATRELATAARLWTSADPDLPELRDLRSSSSLVR